MTAGATALATPVNKKKTTPECELSALSLQRVWMLLT